MQLPIAKNEGSIPTVSQNRFDGICKKKKRVLVELYH